MTDDPRAERPGGDLLVLGIWVGWLALLGWLSAINQDVARLIVGATTGIASLLVLPACFGWLYRQDRVLFASMALPWVALSIACVLASWVVPPAWPVWVLAMAWIGIWLYRWTWIKPRWSRMVLRRAPDPEDGFRAAWQKLREMASDPAALDDLWVELVELRADATERMAPLIDTWLSLLDLGARSDADARAARIVDRRAELLARYNTGYRTPGIAWPDPARPTAGTQLELAYPELEALVAVATEPERRELAQIAARSACRRAGLDPKRVQKIVSAVEGEVRIEDLMQQLEVPDSSPEELAAQRRRWLRELALAASMFAEDPLPPEDAAQAIYQSARGCDDQELHVLESELRSAIDPARRATANEVEVDHAAIDARRQAISSEGQQAHLLPVDLRLATVAAIALAAAAGGVMARTASYPMYADLMPETTSNLVYHAIQSLAAAGTAWLLLAAVGRRPRGTHLLDLLLAMWIAEVIGMWLSSTYEGLIQALAPAIWDAVFAHRTNGLPYGPLYAIVSIGVLLIVAVVTRRRAMT